LALVGVIPGWTLVFDLQKHPFCTSFIHTASVPGKRRTSVLFSGFHRLCFFLWRAIILDVVPLDWPLFLTTAVLRDKEQP
jgi:hypothetical protein